MLANIVLALALSTSAILNSLAGIPLVGTTGTVQPLPPINTYGGYLLQDRQTHTVAVSLAVLTSNGYEKPYGFTTYRRDGMLLRFVSVPAPRTSNAIFAAGMGYGSVVLVSIDGSGCRVIERLSDTTLARPSVTHDCQAKDVYHPHWLAVGKDALYLYEEAWTTPARARIVTLDSLTGIQRAAVVAPSHVYGVEMGSRGPVLLQSQADHAFIPMPQFRTGADARIPLSVEPGSGNEVRLVNGRIVFQANDMLRSVPIRQNMAFGLAVMDHSVSWISVRALGHGHYAQRLVIWNARDNRMTTSKLTTSLPENNALVVADPAQRSFVVDFGGTFFRVTLNGVVIREPRIQRGLARDMVVDPVTGRVTAVTSTGNVMTFAA